MIRYLIWLIILVLPWRAWGEEHAGILPIRGSVAVTHSLNPALGRAVAEYGLKKVLGPSEVEIRLKGKTEVKQALDFARQRLEVAAEATLYMNRPAAIKAALESLHALRKVRTHIFKPELIVKAEVTLARAQLLEPADKDAARDTFQVVLHLDPEYQPDDQLPPRAHRLFAEIRQKPIKPPPPSLDDLQWLAERAGLTQLVFADLTRNENSLFDMRFWAYQKNCKQLATHTLEQLPDSELLNSAAQVISQMLSTSTIALGLDADLSKYPSSSTSVAENSASSSSLSPRPWYRYWWVWTLSGVVAVALSVGLPLALMNRETKTESPSPPNNGFSLYFHFR